MVNMPEYMPQNGRNNQGQGIPLTNFGTNQTSSGESSNGVESPNGEETSQKALLPKNNHNATNNGKNCHQAMMIRPQPRSRPALSNMIGYTGPTNTSCSIEDEKAYTTIPLSPLSTCTDESLLNDSLASAGNRMVTMTGTIRRGQKPVQVQLQLTDKEIKAMNRSSIIEEDKKGDCIWGLRKGLHIVILSLAFIPFAFLSSLVMCFYVGTVCWYNIYLYLSEERTIWHKIFLCPLLIIFYPLLIVLFPVFIALFAALKQISWYFSSWYREVKDFDKGVFGWLCSKLDIPQCAPYEVVVIDEQLATPASIGDTTVDQTAV